MSQSDWVGDLPARQSVGFIDIRNQRPSTAQVKAELLLQLGRLINTVPPRVRDGSLNVVRQWQAARESAVKVAKSKRCSVQEITTEINRMQRFG